MSTSSDSKNSLVFDHITIRRFIGLIAIFLPVAVIVAVWGFPGSISASYHEPARFPFLPSFFPYFPEPRDIFVGALFVIGAFLMSYKGRKYTAAEYQPGKLMLFLGKKFPRILELRVKLLCCEEDRISTLGGLAAWGVALFPTAIEKACVKPILQSFEAKPAEIYDFTSPVHLALAAVLFLTTVYFTLVAFKRRLEIKLKDRGLAEARLSDPRQRRRIIYNISGWVTLVLIAVLGLFALILPEGTCLINKQTYWAETVMLELFGLAWFAASKPRFLRAKDEED